MSETNTGTNMFKKTLACSVLVVSLAAGLAATSGFAAAYAESEGLETVQGLSENASVHIVKTFDEKMMYGEDSCEMFAEMSRLASDGYNGGVQGVATWSADHKAWFEKQLKARFGDQWVVMRMLDPDADFSTSAQARIGWQITEDGIYELDPARAVWNNDVKDDEMVYLKYWGDDRRYCSDYLELLSVYDAAKAEYGQAQSETIDASAEAAAYKAVAVAAEKIDAENDACDRLNNRNRVDAYSQPEWKFR